VRLLFTYMALPALTPAPLFQMSEISNDEMKACVPSLLRKIVKYSPRSVCPFPPLFPLTPTHSTFPHPRRVVAFVGMKICEVVLRYLHNLPSPPPASSSTTTGDSALPSPSKKRKPAMQKVKIGLQPVVIALSPDGKGEVKEEEKDGKEVKLESADEEDKKKAEGKKIYIWCLPSTSARVVEYQVRPSSLLFLLLLATDFSPTARSSPTRSSYSPISDSPSTALKRGRSWNCRRGRGSLGWRNCSCQNVRERRLCRRRRRRGRREREEGGRLRW
jgi:hypothetical protein